MIKVFLILASAVLLGSGVLGWMNRDEFIQTRESKDSNNADTKKAETATKKLNKEITDLHTTLDDIHQTYDEHTLTAEQHINNTKSQQTILNSENQNKSKLMEQKAEFDRAIEEANLLISGMLDGEQVDIENLPDKINEMKTDLANSEKRVKELEVALTGMKGKVARNEKTIGTYEGKQKERSTGIALNGTEGTITAVNQDWGFVVINIGKNQGVSGESELIVKRKGEIVGKLSIVSIEPRLTVADIIMDTLKDGAKILPGDKVTLRRELQRLDLATLFSKTD